MWFKQMLPNNLALLCYWVIFQSKPNLNDKTINGFPLFSNIYIYILNILLGRKLQLCLMQSLAVWKMWALKWKIFLYFFTPVLPFSVKLHTYVSTIGPIFTSCILHNSRECLATLPRERIPLAPLLAIPSCWFVCSIVYPAEWYIAASLQVVAEVESSIIPITGTEDLMDWE